MQQIWKYIIEFIFGGGIIVGMDILAKRFSPKYSALLYALPLQFTIAAIFIYTDSEKSTIQQLSIASIYLLISTVLFIVVFYFLTKKLDFWISLGIAYTILIIIGYILLKIIKFN